MFTVIDERTKTQTTHNLILKLNDNGFTLWNDKILVIDGSMMETDSEFWIRKEVVETLINNNMNLKFKMR